MPAAIFQGPSVKILKNTLKFFGGSKITYEGSVDPTAVATDGKPGDIFVQTGNPAIYVKQDSGSTTNWKPILVDGNGSPNQFAGFDASGNLFSIPGWYFDPTNNYGGQVNIAVHPPDINQYNDLHRFSLAIDPTVTSPNYTSVLTQMGIDVDPNNSGFSLGTNGLAARTLDLFLTARTESAHGSVNGINNNMFLGDAALTGGYVSSASLFDGYLGTETGFTIGFADLFRGNFEGKLGSIVNGINGISANVQIAGELNNYVNYFLASGVLNPTNTFTNGIGVFQAQPQFYGNLQNVNSFSDSSSIFGTISNFTSINAAPQFNSASVVNSFTAAALAPNFQSGATVTNYQGLNLGVNFNSGSSVTNLTLANLSPNTTGATVTNATGINVNMQNVTLSSGLPGTAINSQGLHNFNANFTPPAGYSGFFQNNYMGSLLTIDAGAPLSNTYGFMDNLAGSIVFNDDIGPDPSGFGLGISVVGYVGQIAGAAGKTVDTINFAAAGASVPAAGPGIPSGGIVENITLYNALGILPAGGSLNITNLYGFKVGTTFTAMSPANAWGVYVADTNANNWFAKNVVIGGGTGVPNATESFRVNGDSVLTGDLAAGTLAVTSMSANGVLLNDTTGVVTSFAGTTSGDVLTWNGTQWVAAAGGSGAGITALTGDVTATGPGSAVATIAAGAITNAKVSASAAIAYSKLNLSNSIVNADIAAAAAIAYSKLNLSASIVNADIAAAAAIAYSKLALSNSIVNADINASAAIAYSKLNLSNSIVNADVAAAAAIARSKTASGTAYRILANDASGVMAENAAITASRAVASDSNGQLVAATTTAAELNFVNGVTSSIQTQLNAKQASGNYISDLTGDVTATGPGSSAATIAANAVTNAKAAQMAAHTFKGNNTGSTANATDLTATQLTAELNVFTSTLNGLAPLSGGGTTNFLRADGAWAAPSGGGGSGANTALSNLASTAVNTNIVPDSASARQLGSNSIPWGQVATDSIYSPLNPLDIISGGGDINIVAVNGANNIYLTATKVLRGSSFGSPAITMEESYLDNVPLSAATVVATATGITLATATFASAVIEYSIREASTLKTRSGILNISTNGSAASVSGNYNETGTPGASTPEGITFTVDVSGGNVRLLYNNTSLSNGATMRAFVKKFRV